MARLIRPSAVARHVASKEWGPGINSERMLARGIYDFETPGHGGLVAILGVADLDPRALQAAQRTSRIGLVVSVRGRRQIRSLYTNHTEFDPAQLVEWGERSAKLGLDVTVSSVWPAEEDCEWATLALASPAVREAMAERMSDSKTWRRACGTIDYARSVCERWQPDFLAALDRVA